MKTGTIKTDSFEMDHMSFGSGSKALVILPGASVTSVMLLADAVAGAYAPLAEEFTVYLIDRRKELPEGYTMLDMARDTAEGIKALGLERVSIFGASQGGLVGILIAAEHPELVEKLIVGSVSVFFDEAGKKICENWIRLASEGKREELYTAFAGAVYPREVFEASKDALPQMAAAVTDDELRHFIIQMQAVIDHEDAGKPERITCPVLIIGDKTDSMFSQDSFERMRERMTASPDAELFMYDGYGHAVYDLAPDYKERMLDFLLK